MPHKTLGVLFDLDGTLVDSAPDLAGAVNAMRVKRHLPPLPLAQLRPFASHGARGLLGAGFDMNDSHPDYFAMRDEFLEYYERHATEHTRLFEGVDEVLNHLEKNQIAWASSPTNTNASPHLWCSPWAWINGRRSLCVVTPQHMPSHIPNHLSTRQNS